MPQVALLASHSCRGTCFDPDHAGGVAALIEAGCFEAVGVPPLTASQVLELLRGERPPRAQTPPGSDGGASTAIESIVCVGNREGHSCIDYYEAKFPVQPSGAPTLSVCSTLNNAGCCLLNFIAAAPGAASPPAPCAAVAVRRPGRAPSLCRAVQRPAPHGLGA